jgi:hypothetical protein
MARYIKVTNMGGFVMKACVGWNNQNGGPNAYTDWTPEFQLNRSETIDLYGYTHSGLMLANATCWIKIDIELGVTRESGGNVLANQGVTASYTVTGTTLQPGIDGPSIS